MKQLYESCPRFEKCAVNKCPLDLDRDYRNYIEGEKKCTMAKSIRLRLGKDLPWLGLTNSELAAKKRWESLIESEKENIRVRGRKLGLRQREKRLKVALNGVLGSV